MVRRALLALAVVALLAGCEARTGVEVHANPDGTGRVEVVVTLDKEAATRAAGTSPRTDDLTRAGWDVAPSKRLPNGGLEYRASKRFDSPDDAARVLREVGGADGPLRDFKLERTRTFLKTHTKLTGTVDVRRGAASFGDDELTKLLGGQPLGVEATRTAPLDQAIKLDVIAKLPGGTTRASASSGQRVAITADEEQWNARSIAFAVLAIAALAAFVVTLRRFRRAR